SEADEERRASAERGTANRAETFRRDGSRKENTNGGDITMKAIQLHKRGGPEQLVYEDAPKPELSPGDALIRVRATGTTPAELTWAETYSNCDGSERLPTIPGHEVSGVVESVAEGLAGLLRSRASGAGSARVDPWSRWRGRNLCYSNRSLARRLCDRNR